MSGRPEDESWPSSGRLTPASTPSSPLSNPEAFDGAQLRGRMITTLEQYEKGPDSSIRRRATQDIIAHEDLAQEILTERFSAKPPTSKSIPQQVEEYLEAVRRVHYEALNHKNFLMADRLNFLVQKLRRAHRQARGEERVSIGTLLDRAELKQWEVARVFAEGQGVLVNSQGSKGETEFSKKNYPLSRRHIEETFEKVREFLSREPQVEKIMESYREGGGEDFSETLTPEDFHPLIAKLDMNPETREFFRDALEFDPFLKMGDFSSLHRALRTMERGLDHRYIWIIFDPSRNIYWPSKR
jgi:hypothetical protein